MRVCFKLTFVLTILLAACTQEQLPPPPNQNWNFINSNAITHRTDQSLKTNFWLWKTAQSNSYEIVIAGDSRVYRGIDPRFFEKLFPSLRAINLGYSSSGYPAEILEEIEQKLDPSTLSKSIIVLGITPYSLTEKADIPVELEKYKSLITSGSTFSEPINPSFSKLDSSEIDLYQKNQFEYEQYFSNGFVSSWRFPEEPGLSSNSYIQLFREFKSKDYIVSRLANRILEWRKLGIKVYGFIPPISEQLSHIERQLSGFDEIETVYKLERAGIEWLQIDNTRYNTYDGSHLNPKSASLLSFDLATEIHSRLNTNSL